MAGWQRQPHAFAPTGAGACLDAALEINVGGRVFTTRRSTLAAVQGSMLAELFGERSTAFLTAPRDHDGRVFLDRDAESFAHVLDYLRRSGQLVGEFSPDALARLRDDARHFGLPHLVEEVDAAERQMREHKVYEYRHMMYGPLLALAGTPYDTEEKVAAERDQRDITLTEWSNEGWRIDKLSVDIHGVWLDLFLARPTGRWFKPNGYGVLLEGVGKRPPMPVSSAPRSLNGRRRRSKAWEDETSKKRRVGRHRDIASVEAAATGAEKGAMEMALATAPARAARGPLSTRFEHSALLPEVVYDLITDKNPCQGRRPDFITDADVGKIYFERVQGVPGLTRKDRRQRGLQKWSQGDTLWIKQVPNIRYGPHNRGQVWVKAVYGQVLPAGCQGGTKNNVKGAKAAAAKAQAQMAATTNIAGDTNALTSTTGAVTAAAVAAAATAAAAAAAAVDAGLNAPDQTFSYHMYELHWFNEGFDIDSGGTNQWRPSLQGDEKADWCA